MMIVEVFAFAESKIAKLISEIDLLFIFIFFFIHFSLNILRHFIYII